MFKNKKALRTGVLSLAAVVLLTTGGYAASKVYKRKVTATFGTISFEYEGKDVTKEIENLYNTPGFVMESRSYVPVRAIGDVLGVDVDYDVVTKTAKISDPKKAELDKKNGKIKELEDENEKLKKEIETLKGGSVTEETNIDRLQKDLNRNYGSYRGLDFDFVVRDRKHKIDVDITTDLKTASSKSAWVNLNPLLKKYFIEDIVEDVVSAIPGENITGRIYDKNAKNDLASFGKKVGKEVYSDFYGLVGEAPAIDTHYVERAIVRGFSDNRIDDVDVKYLTKTSGKLEYTVDFRDIYNSTWKSMSTREILKMMDKISESLEKEYDESLEMSVDIRMDSRLLETYEKDRYKSSGYLK